MECDGWNVQPSALHPHAGLTGAMHSDAGPCMYSSCGVCWNSERFTDCGVAPRRLALEFGDRAFYPVVFLLAPWYLTPCRSVTSGTETFNERHDPG
jgi:hypothetical protein